MAQTQSSVGQICWTVRTICHSNSPVPKVLIVIWQDQRNREEDEEECIEGDNILISRLVLTSQQPYRLLFYDDKNLMEDKVKSTEMSGTEDHRHKRRWELKKGAGKEVQKKQLAFSCMKNDFSPVL